MPSTTSKCDDPAHALWVGPLHAATLWLLLAAATACSDGELPMIDASVDAECAQGKTYCNGVCTDTVKDPANCDACGVYCKWHLVAGIVLGAKAADKANWLADQSAAGVAYDDSIRDAEERGRGFQLGQIISLAAGGTLAATSAVLLILDSRKESAERRAWITPVITARGALLSGSLRF